MKTNSNISIIDCSSIAGPFQKVCDGNFNRVAEEIGVAMSRYGICYLINHGVDMEKVENIFKKTKQFFELPVDIKRKYRKRFPKKVFHGYSGPGDEFLNEEVKNSMELREFWDNSKVCWNDESTYPTDEISGFKTAFDDITSDLDNIAKKLLRCLERLLKLEDDFLIQRHRNVGDFNVKSQTVARSTYYYTLDSNGDYPTDAIRCGENCDWGSITLVFQDMVGGLEVKTMAGEWAEVPPVKNSIVVNIGLLLEFYTAGQLRAAKHRVRILKDDQQKIKKEPRQSFIHSVNPDGDQDVFPLLPITNGNKKYKKLPAVNAFEYLLFPSAYGRSWNLLNFRKWIKS